MLMLIVIPLNCGIRYLRKSEIMTDRSPFMYNLQFTLYRWTIALRNTHHVHVLHLQGVDPANTAKVEAVILDKLREMAETGFTPGAIEAAVNTIEFSLRENNTGSFPRGLSLMLRAVGAWIYNRDPYTPIQVR